MEKKIYITHNQDKKIVWLLQLALNILVLLTNFPSQSTPSNTNLQSGYELQKEKSERGTFPCDDSI